MALRQILSKALLPNFERDLSRCLTAEMDTAKHMVDSMLASPVYAYQPRTAGAGAFAETRVRHAPQHKHEQPLVKVNYQLNTQGMFQDKESWHH